MIATASLFLLRGLKGIGNKDVFKSPEWAGQEIWMWGVIVVLIFSFNSRGFLDVLN